jgi:dienelactone hydrolase
MRHRSLRAFVQYSVAVAVTLLTVFVQAEETSSGVQATGAKSEKKVQRLATASGIRFALLGEKPAAPAPTLFVFAGGSAETLSNPDYNKAGRILSQSGYLCVSVDLPCHGEDQRLGESGGIDGWRKRVEKGDPLLKDFLARSSVVLDHLVKEGYTDPRRVAVCGTSRGGFAALHFAAAEPRVRCVAAFAPVTTLPALREFKGLEKHAGTQALAVIHLTDKLAGRAVWLCIGNSDLRVNTDDAIAFTRALVKASSTKKTPVPVELHVMPTVGHSIHDSAHDEVAAWVLKQTNDDK